MSRKLSEKELEDLQRYRGSSRESEQPDPKEMISNTFNEPYNASEDLPEAYRSSNIDKSYDKYADDNPVRGNWLKLKRMIGRGAYGGNEK